MADRSPDSAAAATRDVVGRELVITRVLDAPRELVFRMWTEAGHIDRWCAPRGFTIPFSEADLRPGGAWRSHMRAPDGVEHRVSGVYLEIAPPARIAFTHGWEDADGNRGHETRVTVTLEDLQGRTLLTLRQGIFASVADRDGHDGGWNECFDKLAEHIAGL